MAQSLDEFSMRKVYSPDLNPSKAAALSAKYSMRMLSKLLRPMLSG